MSDKRLAPLVFFGVCICFSTLSVKAQSIESDLPTELHLCRNSNVVDDKIAHCSNVIARSNNASALVTARNTRGLALMDAARFQEAVADFTFVVKRNPKIAGFFDNRQNAYRRSGLFQQALSDANRAIQLAPTYSFVYHGRGNVFQDMGKHDLAIADYNEAISLAPDDGGLFIDRGKAFGSQGNSEQAIADFSHAIELDNQKWPGAYRERGLTYKMLGQFGEAKVDLATYDRLVPGDREVSLALQGLGSPSQPSASSVATLLDAQPPIQQSAVVPSLSVIPMVPSGGTFAVPVTINNQLTLKFIVDSGASDVSIPADVVMTLLRTDTITKADFLGQQTYQMADGSTVPSQ